jgi:peptidoglycan/LPS O-acetylase OafA/YrhL
VCSTTSRGFPSSRRLRKERYGCFRRCLCRPKSNDGLSDYGVVEPQEIGRRAEAQRIARAERATAPHGYIAGVDGLRCLAILSVLLFHGGILRVGWVGVWLFFVISGFVITRTLLADAERGLSAKAMFRRFYLKRAFRILPLYLGAILVLILTVIAFASDRAEKLEHLPYLLTFTYNLYRLDSDYVNNDYFSHFWSLSVEEQFYFVYPALLIGLGVVRLRYVLVTALVVVPVIRLIVSLIFGVITPEELDVDRAVWRGNAVYQFGLTQFDAFAIGGLIALNEARIRRRDFVLPVMAGLAAAGLTLYAAIYLPVFGGLKQAFHVNIDGHYAEVWLYSVLDLTAAALLVAVLTGFKPVSWLCAMKVPRHIGRISFGIYVIHLPMIGVVGAKAAPFLHRILERHGMAFIDTACTRLALFGGLSVALAQLSYSLYERPMIELGRRFIGGQRQRVMPMVLRYLDGTPPD